jgi:acyl carrier protein
VSADVLERIRSIFAAIFQVPAGSIELGTSQKNLPAWDSLGHLTLVLDLEQEFGLSFAPEQVEKMTDVAAIVAAIEASSARPR